MRPPPKKKQTRWIIHPAQFWRRNPTTHTKIVAVRATIVRFWFQKDVRVRETILVKMTCESLNYDKNWPTRSQSLNKGRCYHRVHILVKMKQGQCICSLSWSVHCNFTGEGKCNERGWACTPHHHQAGLILPSSLNVRQKAAVATLWVLLQRLSTGGHRSDRT